MNVLHDKLLEFVARQAVKQGCSHTLNITTYYRILVEAARNEFIEDNELSMRLFLSDCHQRALDESYDND